jgi:hypothetical protein
MSEVQALSVMTLLLLLLLLLNKGRGYLGDLGVPWEDNIKMDFKELE